MQRWLNRRQKKHPQIIRHNAGFSFPEVLVSSFILMMMLGTAGDLMGQTGDTLRKASLRDAAQTRIAEDLNKLRREAVAWACDTTTSCSGKPSTFNIPARYLTETHDHSSCSNKSTAIDMVQDSNASLFPKGFSQHDSETNNDIETAAMVYTLDWESDEAKYAQQINIQRTIDVKRGEDGSIEDGNELIVQYSTTDDAKVDVKLNAVLIPTALSRCL